MAGGIEGLDATVVPNKRPARRERRGAPVVERATDLLAERIQGRLAHWKSPAYGDTLGLCGPLKCRVQGRELSFLTDCQFQAQRVVHR